MARLIDQDSWVLLNLPLDEVIELPHRLKEFNIDPSVTTDVLNGFSLPNIGFVEFC